MNEEKLEKKLEEIEKALPTGAGINLYWESGIQKNGILWFRNGFYVYNKYDLGVGYAVFTIKIPYPETPHNDFILQFNGKQSHYLNQHYGLRDYLEETIYQSLKEIGK